MIVNDEYTCFHFYLSFRHEDTKALRFTKFFSLCYFVSLRLSGKNIFRHEDTRAPRFTKFFSLCYFVSLCLSGKNIFRHEDTKAPRFTKFFSLCYFVSLRLSGKISQILISINTEVPLPSPLCTSIFPFKKSTRF